MLVGNGLFGPFFGQIIMLLNPCHDPKWHRVILEGPPTSSLAGNWLCNCHDFHCKLQAVMMYHTIRVKRRRRGPCSSSADVAYKHIFLHFGELPAADNNFFRFFSFPRVLIHTRKLIPSPRVQSIPLLFSPEIQAPEAEVRGSLLKS